MMNFSEIFGPESKGDDAARRAATSSRVFVRSQIQLALDSAGATGRRLSATEALDTFGLDFLAQVADNGGAGIVKDSAEPARTFVNRRRVLRLSKRSLATAAGVTVEDITAAETPGEIVGIRTLEQIAQTLALDERRIGLAGGMQGDGAFGTRLRELRSNEERDESFIVALCDAAWVICRQQELSRKLSADHDLKSSFTKKSGDYSSPIWRKGYELAERTRKILKIDALAAIASMEALAQDQLGIPVVDAELEEGVAGATVLNAEARGIVLNNKGANKNILVRRMTLAHELGHLLWDPEHQLERVRVDDSADLRRRDIHDSIEGRANAFAVAFLAPLAAVKALYAQQDDNEPATITLLVERYGLSASAAAQHLANVCNLGPQPAARPREAGPVVQRKWLESERQPSLVAGHVPASRGGRFAQLTLQAVRKKLISPDCAASGLRIDKRLLTDLF
jgi:Zn-dependent peptidase ImmA (M78 family)